MLEWFRRSIGLIFGRSQEASNSDIPSTPESKGSMAEFLMSLAKSQPEVREAMDQAYFELQTDEPPNGDRYQMYQIIRDELDTYRDEQSETET